MSNNNRGWTSGPDSHELYVEAMESKTMTISPEAINIARAVTSGWMNPNRDAAYRDAQKAAQLAINSATTPLHKEIERLRGEVEKAWDEGAMAAVDDYMIDAKKWNNSRAKRVAEGKE